MECISEAQRNLLDYDFTYEILYSINVYIIYMKYELSRLFAVNLYFKCQNLLYKQSEPLDTK